ncbi:hypothetical protein CK214_00540 [Mesorhizobium sp. WSM3882]|nr:hypothetical protein CK214_00540 [Mesorhizobium sp. WSM3882]
MSISLVLPEPGSMHFDGAPVGHQAEISGTTKGRPKIEAGENSRTVLVSPASKLAGHRQGRADGGDR